MIKNHLYIFRAVCNKILDGDTIVVDVDLGFRLKISNQLLRIKGINAPEKDTSEGVLSKAALEEYLPIGTELVFKSLEKDKDKFGRLLGDVYKISEEQSVSEYMICVGMAKPWDGKGEKPI